MPREPMKETDIFEAFQCMFDEGYTKSKVLDILEDAYAGWYLEKYPEEEDHAL